MAYQNRLSPQYNAYYIRICNGNCFRPITDSTKNAGPPLGMLSCSNGYTKREIRQRIMHNWPLNDIGNYGVMDRSPVGIQN